MSTVDLDLVAAALPAYEIGAELGRGSWGVVVSGRHRQLGRDVAIKQLPRALSADPSVRERFLAEARLLAGLTHPHIVPVYDYVEHEDLCLLVMEQLTGGTVEDRRRRGRLDVATACGIVIAACAGLQRAHQQGVLHRDIKPENLLFSDEGVLKVADFGIAKVLAGEASMATRTGEVLGTPAYMAPEQALGRPIGPQADIYAAGSMLYELLAGRLPFAEGGGPLEMLYRHVHEDPVPLAQVAPTVPRKVADAVMVALARDPDDRHDSAEDFAVALGEAATTSWGPGWLEATGMPLLAAGRILTSTVQAAPAPDGRTGAQQRPAAETIIDQGPRADDDTGSADDGAAAAAAGRAPAQPTIQESAPSTAHGGEPAPTDAGGEEPAAAASRARRRLVLVGSLALVLTVAGAAVLALTAGDAPEDPAATTEAEAEPEAAAPEPAAPDDAEADDIEADEDEESAVAADPEGTILFVSDRDGENDIFAIEPDGSDERNLTASPDTDDRQANWSRDRDRVVFSSDRPGRFAVHTMNPDGSDVQQVTSGAGRDHDPVFSPDGERIAFSSQREQTRSIYVINVDGTGLVRLTGDEGADMRPTWSPDGARLAFHRVHDDDRIDLFVMQADPDAEPVPVTDRSGRDFHPSWSPAEPLLVFASDRDGAAEDVFVVDTTGVVDGEEPGTPRNLTDHPDSDDWDPNWSPDGQWVAFESNRTGGTSDIYVMRGDGSDVRAVTETPATNADPGW